MSKMSTYSTDEEWEKFAIAVLVGINWESKDTPEYKQLLDQYSKNFKTLLQLEHKSREKDRAERQESVEREALKYKHVFFLRGERIHERNPHPRKIKKTLCGRDIVPIEGRKEHGKPFVDDYRGYHYEKCGICVFMGGLTTEVEFALYSSQDFLPRPERNAKTQPKPGLALVSSK